MIYLFLWVVFGLGYGVALAVNAPRSVFRNWLDQLAVVLFCVVLGPVVPVFQLIYRISTS